MGALNTYFIDIIKNRFADANGRARRQEYWMFYLFSMLGAFALCILAAILGAVAEVLGYVGMALIVIYYLGIIVPGICVTIRRLHDTGKSGWFIFISLVPFVGSIILLVFMMMDSTPGENQYGPNPKGIN